MLLQIDLVRKEFHVQLRGNHARYCWWGDPDESGRHRATNNPGLLDLHLGDYASDHAIQQHQLSFQYIY